MELNQIYNVDCLIGMREIPDKSIDMILCDLPYGTTRCSWDTTIPFELLWDEYKRIIKDDGAIVLTASQPFTSALVMSNPTWFRHEWIWEKQRATNFMNGKQAPLKYHENILVFSRKKPKYNPQRYAVLEINEIMAMDKTALNQMMVSRDYDRFGKIDRRKTINHTIVKNDDVTFELGRTKFRKKDDGYRLPKSVIKMNKPLHKNIHPTQKPVPLFEYLIRTYTDEGDTVLDNCIGSGTTAIACINTGRKFIGYELDAHHYKSATERIKAHDTYHS